MKELMVESLLISKRFVFSISIFALFFISCCDKKGSSQNRKTAISEEELMEKYGPKDLNQAEVDSIIKSIKWTTNSKGNILGDKNAKKGGSAVFGDTRYPPTLRTYGENSSNLLNIMLTRLIYETLLKIDPVTYEYIPGLADKWSISEDKKAYFFHINKNAKWQDGVPVTAFDVVATYDLLIDEGIRDPYYNDFYSSKYKRPIALSPNIVMVETKIMQWSLFLYFSSPDTYVLPEHIIGRIEASKYLTEYNNKMMIGSGPYYFYKASPNQFIVLKRNPNWWAADFPLNKNLFNFDEIRINFYTDETILFENFKKGDFDITPFIAPHTINKWVDVFTPKKMDAVKYNHIIRQKIYCGRPEGYGGFAFNIREEPFSDIRVRMAVSLLFNRAEIIKKLFYNEYKHMDSYFANSVYENKHNIKILYWNKFGTPEFVLSGVSYVGEITFKFLKIIATFWWYNDAADKVLQEAKGKDIMLPEKPDEARAWEKIKDRYQK